ncbi:hypothetical protein [Frondihabitans australicus]|uniref:Uncharacterized protein n=1 Tax=Frondihabitans australicus TaxID=386892 RepID=A0A495ILE7_9MICO|nr:hypothetical protein [Frondihabitans australicus]RKR76258.1 hypothetical protein C8E83_3424 [Frondihabitans australicus]
MSRAPGFPALGRTMPALVLTAATGVVGILGAWVAIGVSGWLVVSLLLILGAMLLPRGPMVALLTLQWAFALVVAGPRGYTWQFAVVLAAGHLLFTLGSLCAWLPLRARVQLRLLRAPLLRYVAVQVACQAIAFAVLTLLAPGAQGVVWLAVVASVAALALAALVLVPALLRPAR